MIMTGKDYFWYAWAFGPVWRKARKVWNSPRKIFEKNVVLKKMGKKHFFEYV